MRFPFLPPFKIDLLTMIFTTVLFLAVADVAGADPTLLYSTYLGGRHEDIGFAVAARGGTYIAGTTRSLDFPVIGVSSSKQYDEYVSEVFVTAIWPSGDPIYSTYIPMGNENNYVVGIAVDADGSAYVVGLTYYGADTSITVAKLEPWGGVAWIREPTGGRTYAEDMALDAQGNVYLTGWDNNEDEDYGYVDRAFVVKIGSDGFRRYWTTIDGNASETGLGIAVDAAGNAYVTGVTASTNLPRAIQPAPSGEGYNYNAFVTKLDPAGSILWSTYLGGNGEDVGEQIGVAADGSLVVAGTTRSPNFPTLNALQTSLRGPQDLFLVRLKPWGSRISSTYLGGNETDEVTDLALETSSILLAAGTSAGSPLREPLEPSCTGSVVAKLDRAASRVLDAACVGSSSLFGMAADSSGISLTGLAGADLPLLNPWQPSPAGGFDAFVTKLVLNHPPDCSAATARPGTLWPPDGRFVSVSIRGVSDVDGDPVALILSSIFQDEWLTSAGKPDAIGLGTSTTRLRASRLNDGNGRVYHLRFTTTDARGDACSGTVKVCVPIEQGGTCVDGGARMDSTQAAY